jgi:hypothetical protein
MTGTKGYVIRSCKIAIALAVVCIAILVAINGRSFVLQWRSKNFPHVDGRILRSEIKKVLDFSGTNVTRERTLDLQYSYEVDGQEHLSGAYTFYPYSLGYSELLALRENHLKSGLTVPVFFDPRDPSKCALWAGRDALLTANAVFSYVFVVLPIGLILVWAGTIWFYSRPRQKAL